MNFIEEKFKKWLDEVYRKDYKGTDEQVEAFWKLFTCDGYLSDKNWSTEFQEKMHELCTIEYINTKSGYLHAIDILIAVNNIIINCQHNPFYNITFIT